MVPEKCWRGWGSTAHSQVRAAPLQSEAVVAPWSLGLHLSPQTQLILPIMSAGPSSASLALLPPSQDSCPSTAGVGSVQLHAVSRLSPSHLPSTFPFQQQLPDPN